MSYQVLHLFLVPVTWALILVYVTWPLHRWLRSLLSPYGGLSAFSHDGDPGPGIRPAPALGRRPPAGRGAGGLREPRRPHQPGPRGAASASVARLPWVGTRAGAPVVARGRGSCRPAPASAALASALAGRLTRADRRYRCDGVQVRLCGSQRLSSSIATATNSCAKPAVCCSAYWGRAPRRTWSPSVGDYAGRPLWAGAERLWCRAPWRGSATGSLGCRRPSCLASATAVLSLIPFGAPIGWGAVSLWLFSYG